MTCETDRARFLGRGRSTRDPVALDRSTGPLSGTTGAVLDPIFALRARVRLEPGQSASVAFTTLVAATRERAFELADRYRRSPRRPARAGPRLDLRARWSCASWASAPRTRPSSRSWPGTSSTATPRSARRQAELRAEPGLAAAALGARRLGRLADSAGHDRVGRRAADAAPAARGPPLLAAPRHDGGPRRPQQRIRRATCRSWRERIIGGGSRRRRRRPRSTARAACSSGGATSSSRTSCSCCAPPRGCTSPATAARSAASSPRRGAGGGCAGAGPDALRRGSRERSRRAEPTRSRVRAVRSAIERWTPAPRWCSALTRATSRCRTSGTTAAAERNGARPPGSTTASAARPRTATTRSGCDGDRLPPAPWANVIANPPRRLPGHRAGRRVHLGREQLLLPAHALAQRSGERPG